MLCTLAAAEVQLVRADARCSRRRCPLCFADEELLQRCKSWTIVGKDLIKEVRCVYCLAALV